MPKSFIVDCDFNDSRLDKWFKHKVISLPHSLLEKIIRPLNYQPSHSADRFPLLFYNQQRG